MKRLILFLATVCAVCSTLAFAACGGETALHEHTFAKAWSGDGTYHWHAATCEHTDEVSEYGEHSWDDGVETTPAGCTSEGVKTYTCTVCERTKKERIPATGHTFAQAWSGDGSHHWHAATCEHTDEVSEYGEHSWDDGVCTVCKYVGGVEALEYTLNDDGESYSVTGIGACSMEEFTIPSIYNGLPVTGIGDYAFSSCAQLKSVVVPDSVTGIGNYAFSGCKDLMRVVIGIGTKRIGDSAFSGCTNLVQLVLGSGVTSISEYAFV